MKTKTEMTRDLLAILRTVYQIHDATQPSERQYELVAQIVKYIGEIVPEEKKCLKKPKTS